MSQKTTHAKPTAFCHLRVWPVPVDEVRRRHSINAKSSMMIPTADAVKKIIAVDSASEMPRYKSITRCNAPEHKNASSVFTILSTCVDLLRQRTSLAIKLLIDDKGQRVN